MAKTLESRTPDQSQILGLLLDTQEPEFTVKRTEQGKLVRERRTRVHGYSFLLRKGGARDEGKGS